MDKSEWAEAIRTARKAAGLSQRGLSTALGIPRRTIEDWERGRNVSSDWVQKLLIEKLKEMEKKC